MAVVFMDIDTTKAFEKVVLGIILSTLSLENHC